ncbi:MAG: hypothetical protein GY935_06410 [Gammaproteobacteria bacterium]|nr:hypothetical protein [Gammaproteobacteria bacterium]
MASILAVDDYSTTRQVLSLSLKNEGHPVAQLKTDWLRWILPGPASLIWSLK